MTGLVRVMVRGIVAACLLAVCAGYAHAAGVLAIGKCGAYGFAYDFKQAAAARAAALKNCNGPCKAVAVNRGCAALAIDGRNFCGAHGYAVAPRLGEAQNTALRRCYRDGGQDCVIRAFVCDARG
jgi:hypothetical protein